MDVSCITATLRDSITMALLHQVVLTGNASAASAASAFSFILCGGVPSENVTLANATCN